MKAAMLRWLSAALVMGALAPLVALAQAPDTRPADAKPAETKPAETKPAESKPATPKVYIPGLEQFMNVILTEHNKLWFAGRARNWPLAAYELGEIKEVMSDVQDFVPVFKSLPLADMMDAVIVKEIADLEKAIEAKDPKAFAAGFDRLTAACNACHQGTENGFIVIKRPTRPTFTNQDYRPHDRQR
ncbi:hypothetical protein ASD45_07140 [Pseudolabrys sp. Root1462]|nr:hypothetical protein ASD45_07140 [Pseudolabrys sp. Root1462]